MGGAPREFGGYGLDFLSKDDHSQGSRPRLRPLPDNGSGGRVGHQLFSSLNKSSRARISGRGTALSRMQVEISRRSPELLSTMVCHEGEEHNPISERHFSAHENDQKAQRRIDYDAFSSKKPAKEMRWLLGRMNLRTARERVLSNKPKASVRVSCPDGGGRGQSARARVFFNEGEKKTDERGGL